MTVDQKIFGIEAPKYWASNIGVVPVKPGTKEGVYGWKHYQNNLPKMETREQWLKSKPCCGIAVVTGWKLEDGTRLFAIDVDDDAYVAPVKAIIGQFPCVKKGQKGLTIFVRCPENMKGCAIPKAGARIIDVIGPKHMCVLPPSIHPKTKRAYEWVGTPLHDVDVKALPFMSKIEIDLLQAIIENEHHAAIMTGEGTHDPALSLVASLVHKFADRDMVCRFIEAFLPTGYDGNLREELPGMFDSAVEKFKETAMHARYEPGKVGPIPMGYTQNNTYVFMNQKKNLLTALSPQSLLAAGNLYDLAPAAFMISKFPKFGSNGEIIGVNLHDASNTLIQACKNAGPFITENVRGSGVWREGKNIVLNWSGPMPQSTKYIYVRFVSLPELCEGQVVDAKWLLDWLSLFNWEKPGYALMALGWLAAAPICGALEWRPHIFINGPKNCGKSTLIEGFADLLHPMAIVKDGSSTEAGLRQTIGADSRPVILDEFESDHDVRRMRSVIKMIRSASSSKGAVVRGTPEGKALQFHLHASFCLGAINPIKGTAADASRMLNLGIARHDNNIDIKNRIGEGLDLLHQLRGAWPGQMIALADLMFENIAVFEQAMPPGDSRHNKNVSTLMGAAFTALEQKKAGREEAEKMIAELADVLSFLAEAHEDDDAANCLNHLLCFSAARDGSTIGQMIQDGRSAKIHLTEQVYPGLEPYGIRLGKEGVLVSNCHPGLKEVFKDTIWEYGAWVTSLRRLPNAAHGDEFRVRFSAGSQQRCTLVPYELLDEPKEVKY